jgi:rhodanese-related sulfurtransferase
MVANGRRGQMQAPKEQREVGVSWLDFVAEQWLLCSLLAILVTAFLILESRKGGATVSHHQATRLLNDGDAVLLDLRESSEFKAGHIAGAIHLPFASVGQRASELEKHKAKQIILVDKMGQHAGAAGKILREKGFNVVRLSGGMVEWTHQNLPVVKT